MLSHEAHRLPPADDLQIAGFVPLSTVDWPGKLVASVFTQGCPWSCVYCHNYNIIDPTKPGEVAWSHVEQLLQRRQGLLDGIVFSGGEALRQRATLSAAAIAKDLGFEVGLHTAGPFPGALADMIDHGLVDWVGLDMKATPQCYPLVVGRPNSGGKAWACLDTVLNGGIDYEVRLTVYPQSPGDELQVAQACRDKGVRTFALQQARGEGAPPEFQATRPGWDDDFHALADDIKALDFDNFIIRPA